MKQLESLYAKLPAQLQDLAVTAQGWLYRTQRYSSAFAKEHAFLCATEKSSALQLELFQTARLKRILAHAAKHIPYYQTRIQASHYASLRPGDLRGFFDLPTTPKSALRTDPLAFLANREIPSRSIVWNTSGTTGTPMTIYYEAEAVARQYAFVERYREEAGVSRHVRRAQFTGKLIAPPGSTERFWRYDWANRCLLLSTVHLEEKNIPRYLAAIGEFGAEYLTGYPSAIALLAQYALRHPESSIALKAILTSAETLLEEQRIAMESAFGARVHDQYGQTEMQSFWFECRYGRMHAHPLFGYTEILDSEGKPCRPGEFGDVVLTGFLNSQMPLIRYEVGDRAAFSAESDCPCGRKMPIIAAIEGRRDDYVYSRERGFVGRLDPVLKGVAGILECQFVQEEPDSLEVHYVPLETLTAADLARLRRNLQDRLGHSLNLRFHECASIPRGANGKFRSVISRLPKDFAAALHEEEVLH